MSSGAPIPEAAGGPDAARLRGSIAKVAVTAAVAAAATLSTAWVRPRELGDVETGDRTMKSALGTLWKRSFAGILLVPLLGAARDGIAAERRPDAAAGDRECEEGDVPAVRDERRTDGEARDERARKDDRELDEERRQLEDEEREALEEKERRAREDEDRKARSRERARERRLEERARREAEEKRRREREDEEAGEERPHEREDEKAGEERPREREDGEAAEAGRERRARTLPPDGGTDRTVRIWDAATGREVSPAGTSLDVIALATALVDAVGAVRITKLRSERFARLAEDRVVSDEERAVAALEHETAELKVDLLRRIAVEALEGARAELEVATVEDEAARQRHAVGQGTATEAVAARGRRARAESGVRILEVIIGAAK